MQSALLSMSEREHVCSVPHQEVAMRICLTVFHACEKSVETPEVLWCIMSDNNRHAWHHTWLKSFKIINLALLVTICNMRLQAESEHSNLFWSEIYTWVMAMLRCTVRQIPASWVSLAGLRRYWQALHVISPKAHSAIWHEWTPYKPHMVILQQN